MDRFENRAWTLVPASPVMTTAHVASHRTSSSTVVLLLLLLLVLPRLFILSSRLRSWPFTLVSIKKLLLLLLNRSSSKIPGFPCHHPSSARLGRLSLVLTSSSISTTSSGELLSYTQRPQLQPVVSARLSPQTTTTNNKQPHHHRH